MYIQQMLPDIRRRNILLVSANAKVLIGYCVSGNDNRKMMFHSMAQLDSHCIGMTRDVKQSN